MLCANCVSSPAVRRRYKSPHTRSLWPGLGFLKLLPVGQQSFLQQQVLGQGACLRLHLLLPARFSSSAGIAANTLLANILSALNKPHQQTIVPPRCLSSHSA